MERQLTLTCETPGCENKDLPIVVVTDAVEYLCGACMVYINKVEETNGSTEAAE